MLSPSDFNNAVPQFTNGDYASNPINPQYIAEPNAVDYNRGAEPLQTLPAQWWNWFLNKFTGRFNKVNIYVKNIFNELTQLLSLVSVTPSGTEGTPTVGQLKDMFENKYPNYLALLMYPVGSIYWTGKAPDDGGDPNELFGGTWVQIKNCFIWAKGDNDTLNGTGGSKTVTLTEQQIPSHTHTFIGSAVTSGANNRGHTHSYSHTHNYTPSGKIASTSGGTDNKTATESSHTHGLSGTFTTGGAINTNNTNAKTMSGEMGYLSYNGSGGVVVTSPFYTGSTSKSVVNGRSYETNKPICIDVAHRHQVTLSGNTGKGSAHSHTAYFTGTAGTTTSQSTTTSDGESQNHTHSVTASGTNSSTGGGQAHDNMPPYIVKYCWERTA